MLSDGGGIISESGGDYFSELGGEIISESGGGLPRNLHRSYLYPAVPVTIPSALSAFPLIN
ncbi:hypothetical protein GHK53_03565 [Sinorhizobium meliloti]|uniref:Uncharacterized protein n=1 Tax=Rhizobium meliloti TaxID=382 RepID=A0AAW9TKP6_RHIML|nr:hypothetical protein [Sinorhizobium meliloti]